MIVCCFSVYLTLDDILIDIFDDILCFTVNSCSYNISKGVCDVSPVVKILLSVILLTKYKTIFIKTK